MDTQNPSHAIYIYLERIGNLIRAHEWTLCREYALQPVQLHMLYYLSRCDRYSNTPSGVTDYLQLTKGTVSQSLNVLESKGLIEKQADLHDKRQIHLIVTADGRALIEKLPPDLVFAVSEALGEAAVTETVAMLQRLLGTAQRINGSQGFGVCRTCEYHQTLDQQHFRCGLTGEILTEAEADLICREHTIVEPSPST